jgi:hypothetical protein
VLDDVDAEAEANTNTVNTEANPEAIGFEADGFPDFESEGSLEPTGSSEDLYPDLMASENLAFEGLESTGDFDLAMGEADDWTAAPDLSLDTEANADLGDYADLDLDTADFDRVKDDSAAALDAPFTDAPFTNDFDLAGADDLSPDLLSLDPLAADEGTSTSFDPELGTELGTEFGPELGTEFDPELGTEFGPELGTEFGTDWAAPAADLDFTDSPTPAWEEGASDFDSDLVLDAPDEFDANLGPEFDPALAFDPRADATDAAPNPFLAEAFLPEAETSQPIDVSEFEPEFDVEGGDLNAFAPDAYGQAADADLPFSTMELDQTAEGEFGPGLTLDSSPDDLNAYDNAFGLEQPEIYPPGADLTSVPPEFTAAAADLAFESVEFEGDDFSSSGFEDPGFSDAGFGQEPVVETSPFNDEVSFGDEGFGIAAFDNESFGNEGFDNEGFDGEDVFSDSPEDSNGFIQDHNDVGLDDEPDATDDFIQEFGSDPSTHVALTPDQFNDDGSVRRSRSSNLPLRLILGLGLGALVLALAGLLLSGLLGRLRQPSPGGDPVVTEPATPDPGAAPQAPPDPAAVEETDLFRQAVNAAQTAANQAQTATTADQWQAVADSWAASIALMERVPEADPNYAVAQQKAVEYQPNLNYAQQNAARLR